MSGNTGSTDSTPPVEDNLLGLSKSEDIDYKEAEGVARAERALLNLDELVEINTSLILEIHKLTFSELYDWAGKWRNKTVKVGPFVPPEHYHIPNLMYQFTDELKFQLERINDGDSLVHLLAYCHHRIVFIHPFNNGNGRTARLLTNLIAFKKGYGEINIYHRTGKNRQSYIKAIRQADSQDFSLLEELIKKELKRL